MNKDISFSLFIVILFFLGACSSPSKNFELEKARTPVAGQWLPGDLCEATSEGQMRVGYTTQSMVGEAVCETGIQQCTLGQWKGPILYEDCHANTKSCDGQPHGFVQTGYLQQTTPQGTPCPEATRTCQNGQWVGPVLFPSCIETL